MSRADVKELGEIIDGGQEALVIVGESKLEEAVDKAALKAEKHVAKELDSGSPAMASSTRTSIRPRCARRRGPAC